MAKVELKHPKESFDSLLRRFKKSVDKENILRDYREKEFFEKPSSKRKHAKAAARKRTEKQRLQTTLLTKKLY